MDSLGKITEFCLIFSILLQSSFLKKMISGPYFGFFELKAIICVKIDHLFFSLINSGPFLRMRFFFQTSIIHIYKASSPMIQKFILGFKFWALDIIFSKQNFRLEILGRFSKVIFKSCDLLIPFLECWEKFISHIGSQRTVSKIRFFKFKLGFLIFWDHEQVVLFSFIPNILPCSGSHRCFAPRLFQIKLFEPKLLYRRIFWLKVSSGIRPQFEILLVAVCKGLQQFRFFLIIEFSVLVFIKLLGE